MSSKIIWNSIFGHKIRYFSLEKRTNVLLVWTVEPWHHIILFTTFDTFLYTLESKQIWIFSFCPNIETQRKHNRRYHWMICDLTDNNKSAIICWALALGLHAKEFLGQAMRTAHRSDVCAMACDGLRWLAMAVELIYDVLDWCAIWEQLCWPDNRDQV